MRRNVPPKPPSKGPCVGGGGRDGAQAFLRNKAIFQGAFTRSSRPADRLKAGHVRLRACVVREVEVLSRHTLSGL